MRGAVIMGADWSDDMASTLLSMEEVQIIREALTSYQADGAVTVGGKLFIAFDRIRWDMQEAARSDGAPAWAVQRSFWRRLFRRAA